MMDQYHKIQTVYKRDPSTKFKTLLLEYALEEFEYLSENTWIFTEKVDGTNIRVMCSGYSEENKAFGVTFGGKTDNAQIPAFLVSALEHRFHSDKAREKITSMFPDGACLYGEGYGAKIQKCGSNYRNDQDFVLFDVKVGEYWLRREDVEDVAAKLEVDVVPIVGKGTLFEMIERTREGFQSQWGPFLAEGIVARPSIEIRTRSGNRIITKIKHKDFI